MESKSKEGEQCLSYALFAEKNFPLVLLHRLIKSIAQQNVELRLIKEKSEKGGHVMKIKRRYIKGGKYITVQAHKLGSNLSIKQQKFVGGIPIAEMEDGTIIKPTPAQVKVVNLIAREGVLYTEPYYYCIEKHTGNEIRIRKNIVYKLIKIEILKKKTTKISKKELIIINE